MNHPFWGTPIFGNYHLMDSILTLRLRHREEENPLRNAENIGKPRHKYHFRMGFVVALTITN